VNSLLWTAGYELSVEQVRAWMRELLSHPNRELKPVQEGLARCRAFLKAKNALLTEET
jgi:hypothetical protein